MTYCRNCAHELSPAARQCPKCGVAVVDPVSRGARPKDKTVAVLLAVFLGFWTWLYTFDTDAWKFWVGLGTSIAATIFAFLLVPLLALFGIWLWAIIDVAVRPATFYDGYPNG